MRSPLVPRHGGRFRRRLLALIAAPALGLSLLAATPSPAVTTDGLDETAAPEAPVEDFESLTADAAPVAVTLITGDTVLWSQGGQASGVVEIKEAPRDVPVYFDRSGTQEDFYVIPSDVMEHVVSGAVDMELFNIPGLIEQGLDDESTGGELPVIVTFDEAADAEQLEREANALPAAGEAQAVKGIKGAGVKVDRGKAAKFRDEVFGKPDKKGSLSTNSQADSLGGTVEKILLDQMLEIDLSESVPQIGAQAAWNAGYTGEGVKVAVLDTGVDDTHPDLAGQVVDQKGFVTHPRTGQFAVEQLDHPVRYVTIVGGPGETVLVPRQGAADPLVYVGRACVDSEGDELLADPAGKTALIVRGPSTCTFAEKYDAAVEAGATAVVIYNDVPGVVFGSIAGAEHVGEVWVAAISDLDGAVLRGLLDAGEEVVLGLTDEPPAGDDHGHGTHVASTIAGTGAASNGARRGVAPGANLLNGKVCNFQGQCPTSATMAAMEWAVGQGADVVNMSLGSRNASDGTDPLSQLVNQLSAETDTLFVTSAGNEGEDGLRTVGTPGAADAALAVGAVDKSDQMADFSSRGPRLNDHAVKPEITAPGVGIIAARAAGTSFAPPVDDVYTTLDGTSMAAPHVAGAAALLAQATPDLDGEELKDALVSTAADGGHRWYEQGTGRVDVPSALNSPIYASGTVNLGGVDGQAERDIVYTNSSDQDITLSLDAAVTDTDGQDTDDANVSLSTDALTVPAHGQASVAVTATLGADMSVQEAFGAVVTATGPGVALRTAVGFGQFMPKVTIEVLDSNGDRIGTDTALDQRVYLTHDTFDPEAGGEDVYGFSTDAGVAVGHVPVGTYTIATTVGEYKPGASFEATRGSLLVEVEVDIDTDTTIVLDARDAVLLKQPEVPRKADKRNHSAEVIRVLPGSGEKTFSLAAALGGNWPLYATPAPPGELAPVRLAVSWTLAEPQPLQTIPWARDCPQFVFACYTETPAYVYNLPILYENGIPDDLHERIARSDLVEVPTRYHSDHPDALINQEFQSHIPGDNFFGLDQTVRIWFRPGKVTQYFLADDRVTWLRNISIERRPEGEPSQHVQLPSADRFPAAEAGARRSEERWFEAPLRIGTLDVRAETLDNPLVLERQMAATRGGPDGNWFTAPWDLVDNSRGHGSALGNFTSTTLDHRMWNADTGTELEPTAGIHFPLSPDDKTVYRLEQVVDLPTIAPLRTGLQSSSTWTFTSRRSDAQVPQRYQCPIRDDRSNPQEAWSFVCQMQPLILLEYDLGLDIHNRAPAGRAHRFTIVAGHHSKALDRSKVTDLSVQASFDDGETWTDARVVGGPKDTWDTGGFLPSAEPYQQYRVVLPIPPLHRTNGFVSLRVKAEDANGGTVEQTIDRAYILKAPDSRGTTVRGPKHTN